MSTTGRAPLILAALLAGGAAVVFGATVLDALRVEGGPYGEGSRRLAAEVPEAQTEGLPVQEEEVPEASPTTRPSFAAPASATPYPRVTEGELLEAVNLDLFQPDRSAPLMPYLLPGERPEEAPQRQDERRERGPEIRVVGAALMGNQALALVQLDDTLPVALMLGESLEGYTLAAVDEAGATLVRNDETLTLPVVEPLRSGSSDSRRGDARSSNSREEQMIEALQQRVQQLMQGRGAAAVQRDMPVYRFNNGALEVVRPPGVGPGGGQIIIRPRGGGGGGGGEGP